MAQTTATRVRHQQATADGLDRVGATLDAAQEALKALRKDLGAGGRDLVQDVETLLKSAKRDTVRLGRSVHTDLEQLRKAVATGGKPAAPARGPAAPTRKRPAATRKPASAARRRPAAS
jgi:ABC-type transporter Mla subunit MlaD